MGKPSTSPSWLPYLLTLADSAYPSGAHGHSNGLEFAIQTQVINSARDLELWVYHSTTHSLAPLDLRAMSKVYGTKIPLLELNAEIAAMRASRVQAEASAQIGRSTLRSALNLWAGELYRNQEGNEEFFGWISSQTKTSTNFIQLPLSWALVCKELRIPLEMAIEAFAMMYIKQCLQVSMRLALIGQSETLYLQGQINTKISQFLSTVDWAAEGNLELQSSALGFEFAGLGHQNLAKRYFRS